VVARTVATVELLGLPTVDPPEAGGRAAGGPASVAILATGERVALPRLVTLGQAGSQLDQLFARPGGVRRIRLAGALCEPFLEQVRRSARGVAVEVVVADSSRVFLSRRTTGWYRRQNVLVAVREATTLAALTVNPVSPLSHRFDSATLCAQLSDRLPGLFVADLGPAPDDPA